MLSGEGNAGERWNSTIGLISKKNNFALAADFFVQFFAVVLHDYKAKLPETFFYGGMSYASSFTFFSLPLIFSLLWWLLAFLIIFVTAATKFSCCSSNKKGLLCYLSLALDPRWVSLACRPLSLFLCLSLALYCIFVDITINLSLIL